MPLLRKIAAICLCSGLYPAFHYVPTRLNPGDRPTRDLPLPAPSLASFWPGLSSDELYEALSQPKLRRWAANWARLTVLLHGSPRAFRPSLGWRLLRSSSRAFDSTLNFPGEVLSSGSSCSGLFCWGSQLLQSLQAMLCSRATLLTRSVRGPDPLWYLLKVGLSRGLLRKGASVCLRLLPSGS